jgi:hypothetical protein
VIVEKENNRYEVSNQEMTFKAGYGGSCLYSQHLEADAEGSRVPGQPGLHQDTLS